MRLLKRKANDRPAIHVLMPTKPDKRRPWVLERVMRVTYREERE